MTPFESALINYGFQQQDNEFIYKDKSEGYTVIGFQDEENPVVFKFTYISKPGNYRFDLAVNRPDMEHIAQINSVLIKQIMKEIRDFRLCIN